MADAKGAYIGGVPVQFKDAVARAMISDEYNSAETYAKGNLCIYNGKIYEAIKETTGTWDATAWEETTLAKVNGKLNGDIASLTEKKLQYIKFAKNVTATNVDSGWYYEIIDVSNSLPKGAILNNVTFDAGNWSANTILTVYDDQKFVCASTVSVDNSYRKFRLYYYI